MRPIDISVGGSKRTFSAKQASEFASSLCRKIEESNRTVNANLLRARGRMKATYDKRNTDHQLREGDQVMLWWPYTKKGISRAFQPKWKGPYQISRLIGDTNCDIVLENGEVKSVHLNQLKLVQKRNDYETQTPVVIDQESCTRSDSVVDLFDFLGDETIIVENNNVNPEDRWCGIDERNVVQSRTRSGLGGGGDG